MGLEDLATDAGFINLVTTAVLAYAWTRLRGRAKSTDYALAILLAGSVIHLVTDVVADLGEHNEHMLLHVTILAATLAMVAAAPSKA